MALLEVKNLHTYFKTRKGIVKAVNDVSYSLESGKTIGIVGESGSGKSVSAMSILQLLDGNGYIDQGEVIFEGRDLTKFTQQEMYEIRGNKISVIFQEPMTSLNPVFTVKKQLSEPFMIHQGMTKKQAEAKAKEMLEAVYDVCVDAKGSVIFAYINSVLENWHKNDYKTPADVKKEGKGEKTHGSAYDLDLFEKMLNSKELSKR